MTERDPVNPPDSDDVRHLQQVHEERYVEWRAACERSTQALDAFLAASCALIKAKAQAARKNGQP